MKVLHVLHTSAPYVAGYCTRSSEIIAQQQGMGIDIQVVTSAQHPNDSNAPVETIDNVVHWRTPSQTTGTLPVLREVKLMRALYKRILEAVEEFKPDILHAHSPVLVGYPALRAARKMGLSMVYEIRDLWENALVDRGRFGSSSPLYLLARRFETHVVKRADQVVTISEQLRQELEPRAQHERITVVGNGVDVNDFDQPATNSVTKEQLALPSGALFGYIGTFQPYEGMFDLVDAFDRLATERSDIGLLIVGGGGIEEELKEYVLRKAHGDRIKLTGKVPRKDVRQYYELIDIFVYPRHDTATTRLTTPLKPLEAMAAKKPVVVSNLPAMCELVRDGETGICSAPGDPAALAKALDSLLVDVPLRKRLVNSAYEWVCEHRTWQAVCENYSHIYKAAIQQSRLK